MLQLHIARHFSTGIVAQGKIAAVHVGATEGITMSVGGMKVRLKKLLPVRLAHPRKADGSCFGEGPTETLELLKTFAWIDQNGRQTGVRLIFQQYRCFFRQTVLGGLGGHVMTNKSACSHISP